jgi:hypothetical protein
MPVCVWQMFLRKNSKPEKELFHKYLAELKKANTLIDLTKLLGVMAERLYWPIPHNTELFN